MEPLMVLMMASLSAYCLESNWDVWMVKLLNFMMASN